MEYKSYVTDLHVNLHPDQMDKLEKWYEHSRDVLDFFTLAYYPYEMQEFPGGMKTEGMTDSETMSQQWHLLRDFFAEKNRQDDYISYLGYEWQGTCKDGDHNVYFKEDGPIVHPDRYQELVKKLTNFTAMGIPHHLAYQLGHRGKNWETHDELFSPFAEIYSSHGSSESSRTDLSMTRHVHMGPRAGGTSVFDGLKSGAHIGIIASGDNHVVPGMVNHGRAGVWAKAYTKDAIWESFQARRVYGFTKNKITLWMDMDGMPMGSVVRKNGTQHKINVAVEANNKIDRIELIKNGDVEQVYSNLGNKLNKLKEEKVTLKFKLECGWGPDLRTYPDLKDKAWQGTIETSGNILSIEQDYNSFGSKYEIKSEGQASFECLSHKTTQSGKWMGSSPIVTEGFIFEIEAELESVIKIELNGYEKNYTVKEILEGTDLIVYYEEAVALAKERFNFSEYYRSDPFYHNAYKARINQGSILADYKINQVFTVSEEVEDDFYLVKVHQTDGQVAWSSPVWLEN